ncbi:MAG: hypothetical protein ACTSPI_14935, partial [Candidatus Heimdallarchaeaceae archaeon]
EVVEDITNKVETNIVKIHEVMDKQNEEFQEKIKQYVDEYSKKGRDIRDKVPNQVEIEYQLSIDRIQQLETSIVSLNEKIENILSELLALDEKVIRKAFGKDEGPEFIDKIEKLQTEYKQLEQDSIEKIQDIISTFNTTMESLSTDIFEKMNKKIEDFSTYNEKTIESFDQKITDMKDEISKQLKQSLKDLEDNINENIKQYASTFEQAQNEKTAPLKVLLGEEIEVELEQEIIALESFFSNLLEKSKGASASFASISGDNIQNNKKAISALEKTLVKILDSLNKISSKALVKAKTSLEKTNDAILEKGTEILQQTIETVTGRIEETINESKAQTEGKVVTKKEELTTLIAESISSLDSSKEKILSELKNSNTKVLDSLQSSLSNNIDVHAKLVESLASEMDATMINLQNELDETKNALDSDVGVTLDHASKNFSKHIEEVKQEIEKQISSEVSSYEAKATELTKDLDVAPEKKSMLEEATNTIIEEFTQLESSYPQMMKEEREQYVQQIKEKLTKYQEVSQDKVNEVIDLVRKDIDEIYNSMSSEIERGITKVNEAFEKENKDYELSIQHEVNSFITSSDSNSGALVTNIQSTKDTLLDTVESTQNTITADLSSFKKTAHDSLNTFLSTTTQQLGKIVKDSKVVEKQKEKYVKDLDSFKDVFMQESRDSIEKVDKDVTNVLKAIPTKIAGVLEATAEAMELMKKVLSLGAGVEPSPIEDTWVVYGTDQVNAAMMGLLSRTKRSATTVSPHMKWISLDWIETDTTISRKRLELVSDMANHGEEDIKVRKKLLEVTKDIGNIILKNRGGLKVLMGLRDGTEEGFIGYIAPTGEPIAVFTFNEIMVEEISKLYAEYRSAPKFTV